MDPQANNQQNPIPPTPPSPVNAPSPQSPPTPIPSIPATNPSVPVNPGPVKPFVNPPPSPAGSSTANISTPGPTPAATEVKNTRLPDPPDKTFQSPPAYTGGNLAQDLSSSNVVGRAVTVTDNNLSAREKIPLMKISLILIFIITGFSGSFLYFRFTSASPVRNNSLFTQNNPAVSATVPANKISPTEVAANPFATPSSSFVNPFAPTSTPAYENPFGEPSGATESPDQPYQNPFEESK